MLSRPAKWSRDGEWERAVLDTLVWEELSGDVIAEQRPEWSKGATRRWGDSKTQDKEVSLSGRVLVFQ